MSSAPTSLAELDVGRSIGRGATSVVRLATSSAGGERYVLKVVEKAKIVGQAQLTRLFREKELLGSLQHASIVTFHATFKDEEHLYFMLELLPGGDLLWHMRRAPRARVAPSTVRVTLAALLLPLRFMQEQGVLYRDLKPTNITFTAKGRLKLIDFGHAKRIEGGRDAILLSADHENAERSMSLCGTPHYNAPEMLMGEGHGLPAQLWALGILLVEMINGKAPFWEPASGSAGAGPSLREQILSAQPDLTLLPDDARPLAHDLLLPSVDARSAAFGHEGYPGVISHAWFAGIEWDAIEAGDIVPDFDYAAHCAHLLGEEAESPSPSAADAEALSSVFADF